METNKQTILEEILDDINGIEWSTDTVKSKAIYFISNFIRVAYVKHKSLLEPQHLSQEYWKKVIGGKTDHLYEIKRKLVTNEILNEFVGKYSYDKRIKSYLLNSKYINNNFNHIIIADPFSKHIETNELRELENYTKSIINDIKVEKGYTVSEKGYIVQDMINTVKVIEDTTEDYFITIKMDENEYRCKLSEAIKYAEEKNYKLIQYGNKKLKYYYVKDLEQWKEIKAIDLSIYYTRQLFDIDNNIIYANRNETNNRLDTNLTNLKSELWEYLTLDNEKLVEIDIANSQFAILANIMKVDDSFYELAINGKLYDYIADKLKCKTSKEAKSKMFRMAFDKVKTEQDEIRELFPITMNNIDSYKKQNGYKAFSNLLQKTESDIMIDNVLFELMKRYRIVTVHDSVRCKVSDYNNVLEDVNQIFNKINFKCTLNNKTNTEAISEPVIESNIESNTNTLEDIESTQTETETIDMDGIEDMEDKLTKQEYNKLLDEQILKWFGRGSKHADFLKVKKTVYESCYTEYLNGIKFNKKTLAEKINTFIQ